MWVYININIILVLVDSFRAYMRQILYEFDINSITKIMINTRYIQMFLSCKFPYCGILVSRLLWFEKCVWVDVTSGSICCFSYNIDTLNNNNNNNNTAVFIYSTLLWIWWIIPETWVYIYIYLSLQSKYNSKSDRQNINQKWFRITLTQTHTRRSTCV